jgi:choline dehydrogenase-like flavoprotein
MRTSIAIPILATWSILSHAHVARTLAFDRGFLQSRATINPPTLSDSYDFVVVGGGLAGLVVAARLAENSTTTVLVIEAGGTGDDVASTINHPGNAYYAGLVGSTHDWQWVSEAQTNANNRVMNWPGGKLLGGSSAINGCYLVRPSSVEVDAWQSLISGLDGADNWTSEKFFAAMDKSETFTPPSADIQSTGQIQYVASSHGSTGPLHASYPGYMPSVVGQWTSTLANVGIHVSSDPSDGDASGAFVTTSTINPTNWTRSYSKSAYIDPFYRPNLHILTDNQVTRIIFSGTTATAVEYGTDRKTVNVAKEVIMSGGPISSPATLMRSGVGPRDVLDAAGVTTVVELPGVGQHLQDHLASSVVFGTNVETAGLIHNNANDSRATTDEFLSYVNSAIAYASTSDLVGDANSYSSDLMGQLNDAISSLPSTDETVIAGYKAVYEVAANQLIKSSSGQVELLLALTGSSYASNTISIQAALQRPFSHGRLYINSSDPTVPPVIDPHYMAHPSDLTILREGLKLARSIGMTEPLNSSITGELSPGANITTDDQWNAWILNDFHTEYHPSCSCSMLPQNQGGVVDAHLKVYGLNNVRVVDSSVFPIEWSAHMMAPTYGLAEQAAEIILNQYSGSSSSSGVSSPTPTTTASHSGSFPQFSLQFTWISAILTPLLAAAMLL